MVFSRFRMFWSSSTTRIFLAIGGPPRRAAPSGDGDSTADPLFRGSRPLLEPEGDQIGLEPVDGDEGGESALARAVDHRRERVSVRVVDAVGRAAERPDRRVLRG